MVHRADTDSLLYLTVTQYPQQLPTQQTKLKLMSKLITRCDLLGDVPKLMLLMNIQKYLLIY